MKNWTREGIYYRRDDVCIFPPKRNPYYKIRRIRINGKRGKPLETGECNIIGEKLAFKMGNRLRRIMRKEKYGSWFKRIFR